MVFSAKFKTIVMPFWKLHQAKSPGSSCCPCISSSRTSSQVASPFSVWKHDREETAMHKLNAAICNPPPWMVVKPMNTLGCSVVFLITWKPSWPWVQNTYVAHHGAWQCGHYLGNVVQCWDIFGIICSTVIDSKNKIAIQNYTVYIYIISFNYNWKFYVS